MASSVGREMARCGSRIFIRGFTQTFRRYNSNLITYDKLKKANYKLCFSLVSGVIVTTIIYARKYRVLAEGKQQSSPTASENTNKKSEERKIHLTLRERRFVKFATIEYDGQLYMTPRDFLESVTENDPRPRLKRQVLTHKQLESMHKSTPAVWKGSSTLFRMLGEGGIISYTEYLFLLSILTKPQSGFHIAFNMFDTDGNKRVDKDEFLVLTNLVAQFSWREMPLSQMVKNYGQIALERIFSHARLSRQNAKDAKDAKSGRKRNESIMEEMESAEIHKTLKQEMEHEVANTTLLVHFFGKKGKGVLSYEDFSKFMENLQTEVLHIEFNEFSKGLPVISELDFAKILLRYTLLHSDEYEAYLDRLSQRLQRRQGVTFEEFKAFCQFLNNLEDFGIAMRMYTLADRSIAPVPVERKQGDRTPAQEFNRAVKICTGASLSEHLVQTVFDIFDEDDDGQLSYKEFIAIMQNRLHRGIHPHNNKNEGWDAFKSCIKEEMRAAN